MAQFLNGRVSAPNGDPLPFVNIIFNQDVRQGTTTDIDGRFTLPDKSAIRQLHFSYIGYQDLWLQLDSVDTRAPWQIILRPQAYDFAAVEVIAGVNPAELIMRRVIRNRKKNDPENLDSYRCRTYNKVVLSWLPQEAAYVEKLRGKRSGSDTLSLNRRQERMLDMMQSASEHHLFLMESLTERSFRHPVSFSETILANKVSGFKEAPFAALANDVQPFSFYQPEVMLLDKAFLNPVSPGSPDRYFFQMEDTLYRQQDTIYLIAFHPRKGKNFNGLKGILYVNTDRYALQNIIAEPADTGLIHFRIEQEYDRPDGQAWFPRQLNYEIRLPKYPAPQLGLQISGRSYVRDVQQNIALDEEALEQAERFIFADSAYTLPENDWQAQRPKPLDTLEERTYELIDSLGEAHQFDKWMDRLEVFARGRWPMGALDLSLSKLIQINNYEGVRLGLGVYTSEQFSSWFTVGAYAGYGFDDHRWKYGAELSFFPDWDKQWEWNWYYRNDIAEAGGEQWPLEPGIISRRLYATRMDRSEAYGSSFRIYSGRFLQWGLEAAHTRLQPLYDYSFRIDGEPLEEFRFSEAALYFRYAYGQQYRRLLGQRVPDGKEIPYPALSFSVKKGFGPSWGGDFPYWQVKAAVDHSFRLIRLGKTSYRLEAGLTDGRVPVSRLFSTSGLGREFQWLTLGDIFQTMEPYEFLSDRYVSLFFRQDFGTLLFRTKWLQPSISLEQHFTIGTLAAGQRPEDIDFNTLEKGYAEAGLVIDNLIRLNYLNVAYLGFGGGVYYRYGAYHLPGGVGENLAFRLSIAFDF
jgi:hypothetical protein